MLKAKSKAKAIARKRAGSDSVRPRRIPAQARSEVRVARIRAAARALLAEKGYENLNLNAVAARAKVPIGTVYQFFPNSAAIVRSLGEENIVTIDKAMGKGVSDMDAPLEEWVSSAFDTVHRAYLKCPVFIETWAGMMANSASRALDNADSLRNADGLAEALKARIANLSKSEAKAAADAITVATGAIERFALQIAPKRAAAMRQAHKQMLTAYAFALANPKRRPS